VLGAVWLNVALLLLLMRTDYPIVGAALIGVIALIAGLVFIVRARRSVEELRMLEATRRVLAEEFGGGDGSAPLQAHSPAMPVHVPAPMMPAEASARLREIREEIRESMSLGSGQRIEMVDASGRPFEPRSRTMRTMLWLWTALPRVPSGTAVAGTLGVIAVSSPTLRRLLALLALARTLVGGASRPST
jgi:hypothetical protein